MTTIPYSRLFVGRERTVAISGRQIYVLSSTTGEVLSSAVKNSEKLEKGDASGAIVAAAINEAFTYLLSVEQDKKLKLWELPELELVNERELPKKPTLLAFTKDSETILVSDKFGDVFSYPFHYVPSTTKPSRNDLSSHENPSNGQLVLGHVSPLNAFLLSHDEKYIITADRDEHIRVSWYPQGYNIEMYCLGHRKYVSAIHIPAFAPEILISGGGDPMLKIWDWMSGQCTGEVQIWDFVEPFIAVKSIKRKRGAEDEDDEERATFKRKGKGKKSKRRKHKQEERDEEEGEIQEDIEQEGEDILQAIEEKVLVVSKITSTQKENAKLVLFAAVGVTALFGFLYPTGSVEHFDFGCPVIDFAIDHEGKIWVSLDTTWRTPVPESSKQSWPVRVVQMDGDGKFSEALAAVENQPLLKSLNEVCVTKAPVGKSPDFYADLKSMPKWSEPSASAAAVLGGDRAESVAESTSGKSLTRREENRLKNKRNVLARKQELARDATGTSSGEKEKIGTVRPFEDVEGGEDSRQTKKAKSTAESEEVEMES